MTDKRHLVSVALALAALAPVALEAAAAESQAQAPTMRNQIGVFLRSTGRDDPAQALAAVTAVGLDLIQISRLPDRATSIHVKDGLLPDAPRKLGREVRLGDGRGEVGQCLEILRDAGFTGPLVIENYVSRASDTDPLDELRTAKAFIEKTLGGCDRPSPQSGRAKATIVPPAGRPDFPPPAEMTTYCLLPTM